MSIIQYGDIKEKKISYCVNCGAQLPDGTRYCTNCGAQQGAASPYYQPPVPQYSTGGLVAWGIITLLLCTIPGVVALVKVANINNARTVEEQQRAVSDVKTWCTVGTVLGVLFYIIGILGGVAAAL